MHSARSGKPDDWDHGAQDYAFDVAWTFRISGVEQTWDWQKQGSPPIEQLTSTRIVPSTSRSRNIPVTVYSMTNGEFVKLESGTEHDLLRRIDRDPHVRWIVAQPFRLDWRDTSLAWHYPDLLGAYDDGTVTVWDVRLAKDQDSDFLRQAAVTRAACAAVGWRYEVFSGMSVNERLNLMWLNVSRRRPPWAGQVEERVLRAAKCPNATVGTVSAEDDGSGELIATMWHLIWRGVLTADMQAHWSSQTQVALSEEDSNG